ncbi:amidohydrolase family protein [Pleomorphochaeta sp. DL1XJH-081]|jgi:5-methylthioadenosine/S-adenosylhomocysteine deaminase|uniref:amidohydrolase family protein n=1 Tax=Pleomorphochaeta sp. DL1XJH-081 TaxID=3409690 RepID=UPI003BB56F18
MHRIVLRHAVVLTIDESDHFHPDGCIVIEDGIITFIGPDDEMIIPQEPFEELDFSGKLVMPGLVNTHIHTHSPLFRNLGEDVELHTWLNDLMWPAEALLDAQGAQWGTRLACVESISNGVTTIADQFYWADTTAQAIAESGLRAFVCSTIFANGDASKGQILQNAADFIAKWKGRNPLIHAGLGPHAPYSVTSDQWKAVVEISELTGVIIHTHISETDKENHDIIRLHGVSPTRWLADLGVLDRHILAAHCVHLSDEDIHILAAHDVHVSYNPVSNLKLVSGIMPYRALRKAGVQLSIGTDGAQSNNTLDLLQDLKVGMLIQKQAEKDPTICDVREAVHLATICGAQALGLEDVIGTLEVGKQADLIAIDLDSPHFSPFVTRTANDLYTALVYSASGRDVADTMVAGRWLMRDRSVSSLDRYAIMGQCNEIRKEIQRKTEST